MHYFSTNKKAPAVTFREAVLNGQPEDKGLYFPGSIPRLSEKFFSELPAKSNVQICFEVMRPYVGTSLSEDELYRICEETLSFDFPLVKLNDDVFALELFHGPTLAFKDVGARFMSRCLRSFAEQTGQKTIVVVATSGDTGGAVAAGFHNVKNIDVVILYPKDKVSRIQEQQLTTLGDNITALKVRGNFDDCQALAKEVLADASLKADVRITSANSINVARWLPQQIYYLVALKQWEGPPPVFSVPSGNFGNICAGMLAHASGIPIKHFIAACNANDTIPRFLATGQMSPGKAQATLSNAMDVALPSNFARIMEIFAGDASMLGEIMTAASISDPETEQVMREVWDEHGYVLDPHGAVGYKALVDQLEKHPGDRGIFLETAHPVKFESVYRILGTYGDVPNLVDEMSGRAEQSIEIEPSYDKVREIILSKADRQSLRFA